MTLTAPLLLAIVEVDPENRVYCQDENCTKTVYKRIHVIQEANKITVLGSECFKKLFGHIPEQHPRYTDSEGRRLTPEERALLVQNTADLIAQFETERLAKEKAASDRVERERAAAEERERQAQTAREAAERQYLEDRARRMRDTPGWDGHAPLDEEQEAEVKALAGRRAAYVPRAKQLIKEKYGFDPKGAGWVGLIIAVVDDLMAGKVS